MNYLEIQKQITDILASIKELEDEPKSLKLTNMYNQLMHWEDFQLYVRVEMSKRDALRECSTKGETKSD